MKEKKSLNNSASSSSSLLLGKFHSFNPSSKLWTEMSTEWEFCLPDRTLTKNCFGNKPACLYLLLLMLDCCCRQCWENTVESCTLKNLRAKLQGALLAVRFTLLTIFSSSNRTIPTEKSPPKKNI
jgi:hypothetical protein